MFLNLIAPINPLGYGVVGFNILRSLVLEGHKVSYFPVGNPDISSYGAESDLIEAAMKNSFFYDKDAPCLRIWHQHEMDKFVGSANRIGWPIFELNKFTDRELHQLSSLDTIFVCSQWAADVIKEAKINPPGGTHVIPLGVDLDTFFVDDEDRKNRPYWTKNSTVFINVGKWELRKGHNELCEAFSKAFKPEDDVELWMLNDNPFIGAKGNEDWKRKFISSPMGAKIKILPRQKTQKDLKQIFNHVDFGVFPSHAEGWNLEILELMACGAPCIATGYSGHTEFLTPDSSILIEPTGMESAQDGKWFHGQGEWCSFEVDQLVECLRHAHDTKQSGKLNPRSETLRSVVEQFTWKNSVKKIEAAL